jgi:DMSO/TMAO reductase YedYZ molybdopterin-dependent catalytic subunit
MRILTTRRGFLIAAAGVTAGTVAIAGRKVLAGGQLVQPALDFGERFNMMAQRLALRTRPLAREFRVDQISPHHPANGGFGALYVDPDPDYDRMVARRFADWRLEVTGLVRRPLRASLDDLRQMPSRTQITMHSCDEGWSAIGQWTGVPLAWLLRAVDPLPAARFVVFNCMDKIGRQAVYGSIDWLDAMHPQTILAYHMNGEPLPVRHGAPLRLRMELQIGYKQLKHINKISLVDTLAGFGKGRGGLFEDYGYQWYAGL